MTIAIKPTASGSTIEQNGSTILTVDGSGNIAIANDLSVTGTFPTSTPDALSTASGSAPSYSARAWVNFNGQGTISIRASQNVSSLTDEGVGNFAVNMTTAMPDVNYNIVVGGSYYPNPQTAQGNAIFSGGVNTSTFRIGSNNFSIGKHDPELIYAAVFR
jgi:hypothetical protein